MTGMLGASMRQFVTLLSIATLPLSASCSSRPVRTHQTTNAQAEWHLAHLNRRFASILKATDGITVIEGWPDNPIKSAFSIGQSFSEPDHHGHKKYTIVKVEEDGVVIEYFSRFDHRSFGKDLIEEDRGTVKLKWKSAQ